MQSIYHLQLPNTLSSNNKRYSSLTKEAPAIATFLPPSWVKHQPYESPRGIKGINGSAMSVYLALTQAVGSICQRENIFNNDLGNYRYFQGQNATQIFIRRDAI